jgi:hypothetical protein
MATSKVREIARKPPRKSKPSVTPALTVANYRGAAEREADEAEKSQSDPLGKFALLGAAAFGHAATLARLAASKQPPVMAAFVAAFARLDVFLERWRKLADRELLWQRWPATPGATFGHYQRAGASALDVGVAFATSVRNGVLAARVLSIKTFQTDAMPVEPTPDPRLRKWCLATMKELADKTLDLRNWPMADLHRDADSILRRINGELAQALANPVAPSDARNCYAFQAWESGKTLKEIWLAIGRHREWERVDDWHSVRGHIHAWAKKMGLRVSKR